MKTFLLFIMWWTLAAVIAGPIIGIWIRRRAHARNFGVKHPSRWTRERTFGGNIGDNIAQARFKHPAPFGYFCPGECCDDPLHCRTRDACAEMAIRNNKTN